MTRRTFRSSIAASVRQYVLAFPYDGVAGPGGRSRSFRDRAVLLL
jgi:hypothetical protein